jgi:esterase/lipase superfamily enzyme
MKSDTSVRFGPEHAVMQSIIRWTAIMLAALVLGACESRPLPKDEPVEATAGGAAPPETEPKPIPKDSAPGPIPMDGGPGSVLPPKPLAARAARPEQSQQNFVKVEVFYATDRSRSGSREPSEFYAAGRGTLEYGLTSVSIPQLHTRGELEAPVWWKLEFREDPVRHVVLLSVEPLTATTFHDQVAARSSAAGQRNVLVFVHGFNVSFEDAVRRTAQIAYDLKFPGVPMTYSWPSQGSASPLAYTTDETNVEWTEVHLRKVLTELKDRVGSNVRVHLIAHSMGNRALTKTLRAMSSEMSSPLFSQLILAAPDIDRDVFERDIAPAIVKTAQRTTLYASSQDVALRFSATVHSYARAGQSLQPLIYVRGLDTVDATGIDTSQLGHSYIGLAAVLDDVALLVKENRRPADRRLRPRPQPPALARYWALADAN